MSAGRIIDPWDYQSDNSCNRCDDCTEVQTDCVPVPDRCVACCNMFIMEIITSEPYVLTSIAHGTALLFVLFLSKCNTIVSCTWRR